MLPCGTLATHGTVKLSHDRKTTKYAGGSLSRTTSTTDTLNPFPTRMWYTIVAKTNFRKKHLRHGPAVPLPSTWYTDTVCTPSRPPLDITLTHTTQTQPKVRVAGDHPNGVHQCDTQHDVPRHPHTARRGRPPLRRQESRSCKRSDRVEDVGHHIDCPAADALLARCEGPLPARCENTGGAEHVSGCAAERGHQVRHRSTPAGWPRQLGEAASNCDVRVRKRLSAPVFRQCCEGMAGCEAPRGACGHCA